MISVGIPDPRESKEYRELQDSTFKAMLKQSERINALEAENAELRKRIDELNTEVIHEKRNAVDAYTKGAKMKAQEDAAQIDVAVRATNDAHNLFELECQRSGQLRDRCGRLEYLLREARKRLRGIDMSQLHIDIDAALKDGE